jgi:NAD(P)-dependent dehydrogenase (short-subunit alcohol dehydrogenase family)
VTGSYVGENKEFARQYLAGELELELTPSRTSAGKYHRAAFLTDISEAWTPEVVEQLSGDVALARCGEPGEVVAAALYFATEASSFATGAILRLDGGVR